MGLIKKAAFLGTGIWAVNKLTKTYEQHHQGDTSMNGNQGPSSRDQYPSQYSGNQAPYNNFESRAHQPSPPYTPQQGANASYYSQQQWSESRKN